MANSNSQSRAEYEADVLFDGDDVEDIGEGERLVGDGNQVISSGSHYRLSKNEVVKGLANRIVHSRNYIILYLAMAALSVTTVIFSLMGDCPPFAFYVLEVIVNGVMILEVAIRVVAFGKQFYTSTFNLIDLGVTVLCIITLLVVLFTPCSGRGKEEEIFDTLLLVARNFFQFGRLALIMRRSGTSIFHRPPPIDLSSAREAAFALDIDLEDDEAVAQHQLQTNLQQQPLNPASHYSRVDADPPRRGVGPVGGDRGRENLNQEDEEMWDRLG